jgi:hypothetical protein
MSVQELEKAVARLPSPELAQFTAWFEEYQADLWDKQIEADAVSGRLDALAEQANREFEAGRLLRQFPACRTGDSESAGIRAAVEGQGPCFADGKRLEFAEEGVEASLLEVMIVGEGIGEAKLFHDDEGSAVGEAPVFVAEAFVADEGGLK